MPDTEELTTVLHIGGWESRCGHCKRGTDPSAETHARIMGYVNNGEPGCGARFVAVSSDYGDTAALKRMRPDLPIVEGWI